MSFFAPRAAGASRKPRAVRRYRSGIRPLEDRVTMSATGWSHLDAEEAAAHLADVGSAGTSYAAGELVVALDQTAPTFADLLAIEAARDAVTAAAVTSETLLAAASAGSPALYRVSIAAESDFAETLAAISNWTSVEWVSLNFDYGPGESVSAGGAGPGVQDSGAESTDPAQTFTITAALPPTISPITDQTISEDGATGILYFSVNDPDTPPDSLAVTTSTSNSTLFPTAGRVLTNLGSGVYQLVVTPGADRFGSGTVTVNVSDGVNLASTTFNVTVTAVNDPPSFVAGPAQFVLRTAGLQLIGGWAKSISQGPNETGQTLSFEVSNDNPSLFSVQPTVTPDGALQYTPSGVYGSALVSLRLKDSGGGNDTSATQTFTIRVDNTSVTYPSGFDPTFASGGVFTAATVLNQGHETAIAVDADGKVLVAGANNDGTPIGTLGIWRLTADGAVDTSFGTSGFTSNPVANGRVANVVVQPDGKILMGMWNSDQIVRFNANGTVDNTFSGDGAAQLPSFQHRVWSIRLQADGKIVVAGFSVGVARSDLEVYRLNADGSIDTTFDGDGIVTIPLAGGVPGFGRDLAIQGDGKIVVVGDDAAGRTIAARLNADGSLDSTFGTGGLVTMSLADDVESVALQADGKILIGGSRFGQFVVGRLNADGSPDVTFAFGGMATPIAGIAKKVLVDSQGRIVAAGSSNGQVAAVRLLANGFQDPSFDGDGIATRDLSAADDQVYDMALQPGGDMVVSGMNAAIFAARFKAGGTVFDPAPSITAPLPDVTTAEDTPTAGLLFTVAHPTVPVSSLTVTTVSQNTTLIPNGNLALTNLGGGQWRLVATPGTNLTGSANITVSVSDGTVTYAETVNVTVNAVNDPPSFVKGADQHVTVGAGLQTIAGWAGGISKGPNETGQSVWFETADDNTTLFSVQPAIAADGTLTYTPSGVLGTAVVSVRARDSGGTAGGGSDTSAWQTFTIQVGIPSPPILPAGSLDPTFHFDGLSPLNSPDGAIDRTRAIARQTDGKLLVVGYVDNRVTWLTYVARFNVDGSLDRSFGTDGFVYDTVGNYRSWCDVVQLSSGQIVVAGESSLTRLNADGSRDLTFGTNGTAIGLTILTEAMTVQADGKYVLAGRTNFDWAVERFNVDGSLDTTFGAGGRVITPAGSLSTDFSDAYDVIVQADGKIVAVGEANSTVTNQDFTIVRYNADGSLDASFAGGGIVRLPLSVVSEYAYRAALQADGKILVAGDSSGMTVVRLNTDGTLDTTFDGDGVVRNISPAHGAGGLAVQADGKIVVAGTFDFAAGTTTFARLNADGSFDASFDGDGKFAFDGNSDLNGLLIQPDGKIAFVGSVTSGGEDALVGRLNANGSFDTSFDADGRYTWNTAPAATVAEASLVLPDGKVLVGGWTYLNTYKYAVLWRLNADGKLDTTFGDGGRMVLLTTFAEKEITGMALSADGKIVLAVKSALFPNEVWRVNADGSFDASFGGDGQVGVMGAIDPKSIAVQSDGKIVIGGIWGSGSQYAVERFNVDGTLDTTFSGDGLSQPVPSGLSGNVYAITVAADGRIVLAGNYSTNFAVLRLNTDGSLDATFDGDGLATYSLGSGNQQFQGVTVQADGKIVLTGTTGGSSPVGVAARYNADGSRDTTFSGDGFATTAAGQLVSGSAVAIQADGAIVVAGYAKGSGGTDDFAVVRFNADGTLDASFDGDGAAATAMYGRNDRYTSVSIQADGRIVAAGTTAMGIASDALVARYLAQATNVSGWPTFPPLADLTIDEDAAATVDFTVTDDDTPPGSIAVTAVASDQTLLPPGSITAVHLGGGQWRLTATPAANRSGNAQITVTVDDGAFTFSDTFTLTVRPVNDVPSFTKGADQLVPSGAGTKTGAGWATGISAGANEPGQSLTFLVSNDDNSLFTAQPTIAADGTLSYAVAAGVHGTAVVSVRLQDDGGTAFGGVDTSAVQTLAITVQALPVIGPIADAQSPEDVAAVISLPVTDVDTPSATLVVSAGGDNPTLLPPGSLATCYSAVDGWVLTATPAPDRTGSAVITVTASDGVSTVQRTFTLTFTAVNDAPSFIVGADQQAGVGSGAHSVTNFATAISPGPNEAGQTVNFLVSTDNAGLFAVGPAISAGGTLTYTLAAGASGTALVTVRLQDNGGTAGGGVDTSAPQTFRIAALAPPTVDPIADTFVDEDGARVTDVFVTDAPGALSPAVLSAAAGDPALLPPAGLTLTNLGSGHWRLTVAPAADRNGTTTVTLTAAHGTDLGTTSFTLDVRGVNDVPAFTAGPSLFADPHLAIDTVRTGWATGISAGPNEATQNLTFQVSVDDPSLFAVAPTIDAAGTLRFRGNGTVGTAQVTVRLHDDGGTNLGGVDTSAPQTFAITFPDSVVRSGLLDPTFDADGARNLSSPLGAADTARDVVRQSDGKLLVVGYSVTNNQGAGVLRRYNVDGTLDLAFGTGGRVDFTSSTSGTVFRLYAVETTADGKIYVAGDSGSGIFLARLNSDGTTDTSYGSGGSVTFTVPGSNIGSTGFVGFGLAMQADGKAVVVRYHHASSLTQIAVVRFTAAGTVDTTFNGTGYNVLPQGLGGADTANDVAVQADGKIVVAGVRATTSSGNDFFAARFNSDGTLDLGFGTAGIATISVGTGTSNDSAARVALQADGKIILAGTAGSDFGLVRLNTDGSLDTSFDGDGKVVTDIVSNDFALALGVQGDGKIVAGGYSLTQGNDFTLVRYTTTGALDTTFDADGKANYTFGSGSDQIYGLLVQPDGRIVVVGQTTGTTTGADFAVARVLTTGALDTSFGSAGVTAADLGPGSATAVATLALADGKTLVAGTLVGVNSTTTGQYAVWRLLDDGSLDPTFGTGGIAIGTQTNWHTVGLAQRADGGILVLDEAGSRVISLTASGQVDATFGTAGAVSLGSTFTLESKLLVQADGSILVVGYKTNSATGFDEFAVLKLSAAGVVDTSYGGSGTAKIDVGPAADQALAATLDDAGRLVVVGTASNGTNTDFALVRLTSGGTLDTTFDGDGKAVFSASTGADVLRSVLVQADGKIVVAGSANSDFAIARFNADGSLDTTFSGDGLAVANLGATDDAYKVLLQADGKLLVVGQSANGSTSRFLLAVRYLSDGSLDTSLDGDDGVVRYSVGKPTSTTATPTDAALRADGKLVAAAQAYSGPRFDGLVIRLLTQDAASGSPPSLPLLTDRQINEDGSFAFNVTTTDTDTPADWLRLTTTSSNQDLISGENITLAYLGSGQWSVSGGPSAGRFGTAIVGLTVSDGATSVTRTFTLDVLPVNDAPSFTKGADVHAGAGAATSVTGWAGNIAAGPMNEFGQGLTFLVDAADPSLFDVGPTIDASGRLQFTAKASAAGQSTTVTVRLKDDGGADRGGVDTSAAQTFTITIGNAPTISPITDRSIFEGDQATVDFSVSDVDSPSGITVTAASGDTAVLPASGIVLSDLGSGNYRLTLTPAVDRYGSLAVTINASDGMYSSTRTFTLDVANVNDAPSFVAGPDQYLDAGAGPQTVIAWAKNLTAGAFESQQQRTFEVTVDDPSLFAVLPAIAADGTLTYTAAGKSGIAHVTVVLRDDGGTAGGGVDTSATQTFMIRTLTYAPIAGDFDPTFDFDGIAAAASPRTALEPGRDVAVQADGKIVVAGIATSGAQSQVFVRRFLADGTLDSSFGTGGVVRFGDGATSASLGGAAAVETAADGTIYVAYAAFSDIQVARLTAGGLLDATYGSGGVARATLSSTIDTAVGMALGLDGKAVVVGSIGSDLGAVRFNADGSLDTSFGTGGFFRYAVNSSANDVLNDVVIENDGRIVAAGYGTLPTSTTLNDWVVVRLTAAGALDSTFSGDGILVASNSTTSTTDQAFRIAVDGLDRIVVAGNLGGSFGFLRLNADGSFDTTFSGDGWATVDATTSTDTVTGLLLHPDGTITAIGNTTSSTTPGMQIARLSADGTPDLTFDDDGYESIHLGDASDIVSAAALTPDGDVVVAGQATVGADIAMAVAQLTPAGKLDVDFAGDGVAFEFAPPASIQYESVASLPDGSYVVGGFRYGASGTSLASRFFIARYTAAGALDTAFGSGGYALHPSASGSPAIVAVQSDGKIVAIGFNSSTSGLVRFNADGTVDATFGTAGVAALPASFTSLAVWVQSDGKILVGGRQSSNVAVARYNADGTLDTTFSGDGVVNFDAGGTGEAVVDLREQADGKIVVGGTASNGSNNDFFVARLNADGTLDTSFDADGYVRTSVGSNFDVAGAMVVQADGRIVIGGATSVNSNMLGSNWALVRYNTDGTLDTTFDGDGVVIFPTNEVTDTLGDLVLQADGRLVGVGVAQGPAGPDSVVARFLPDGRLDPTFAEDGVLHVPLVAGTDVADGVVIDAAGKIVVVSTADMGGRFEGRIFRLLNEADHAPTAAGVYVRGSAWTGAYLNYLDANGLGADGTVGLGYALAGGSTQLTTTIPWSNVDRITVQFDRDVVASVDSLVLVNSAGDIIAPSGFRYLDGRTVEFTMPVLGTDKYLIHVASTDATGIDELAIDGEWETESRTWAQGSGDGTAGGDFNFRFNVLPGDFDSSGSVSFGEIGQARLKLGLNTAAAGYNYRQDYDGSGSITFGEIGQARGRLGTGLSGLAEPPVPQESLNSQDGLASEFVAAAVVEGGGLSDSFAAGPAVDASASDPRETVSETFVELAAQSVENPPAWIAAPIFLQPATVIGPVVAASDAETAAPAATIRRLSIDLPFARFTASPAGNASWLLRSPTAAPGITGFAGTMVAVPAVLDKSLRLRVEDGAIGAGLSGWNRLRRRSAETSTVAGANWTNVDSAEG